MTENMQTPKEVLIDILRAAKDECDDYVDRFCEREYEDSPIGDPLKFTKEQFAERLVEKGITSEDGAAWSNAVQRGWDLVTATSNVSDCDVKHVRHELGNSVIILEDLFNRANVECGLMECNW